MRRPPSRGGPQRDPCGKAAHTPPLGQLAAQRGGVFMPVTSRPLPGVGAVYEGQTDCDKSIYDSGSVVYPEFNITVTF